MFDDWKLANVIPIFKNTDKSDPNCYRGISLTSLVSKLLETIIKNKLIVFLSENNFIVNTQHGFQKGKSCVTNLLQFYDKIFNWIDNGDPVDIMYVDIKKAYDLISHYILLQKLFQIGIRGKLLSWIASWLMGRSQRVVIGGYESSWVNVESGIPQGSILGPLLFLIFINDIGNGVIYSILSSFADDTKVAKKVSNIKDRDEFQADINKLGAWANDSKMTFNLKKTKIMYTGRNNNKYTYKMYDSEICTTDMEKDLGIIVHNSLKMSPHIISSVKKANKLLGLISRTLDYKSSDSILPLYKALVRPLLEFGSSFWNPYQQKDIDIIERVQRRVTKLIPHVRNLEYNQRLSMLGLESLECRRMKIDMVQLYKILRGIDKVDISEVFEIVQSNTRTNAFKRF